MQYIFTSPNQRIIKTNKALSDNEHIYGICNLDATLYAARELTDRAFKLYIRMSLHQDGFTYALSPAEIFNSTGMSDRRYRDAVKELINKGFLVASKEQRNLFLFYENPNLSDEEIKSKDNIKVVVKVSITQQ